jgi:restriction system protein
MSAMQFVAAFPIADTARRLNGHGGYSVTVPDFQTITLPLLNLSAAGEVRTREAIDKLADEFGLTPEERQELLPSGRQTRFSNRVHWAIVYLQKGGLIQRVARGVYRITEQGKTVLLQPPPRIDRRYLTQFEGVREFRKRKTKDETTESDLVNALPSGTPEERIEAAIEDLNEALREDLLERILSMHPTAFEKLIIDLMLGMGYGADGSGRHLGRTADGGVDGIINEDILGLDIIYLQAKRYAVGNSIGVEKIREFAGALDERGATKGVFVTTSRFAPPARQYAQRSPKRLILIDGSELTHFLIKFGVAVRGYQTVVLKKLDVDYFDDLDS